ncbi:MAG: hypothetical protein VZR09_04350 [Candidatus Gastranaerophilaceae bacterium]|nr:hypothetical protein [Candidatus Gastranaerophilaceae bacterium]
MMKKRICLALAIGVILVTSLSASAFSWKFWQKEKTPVNVENTIEKADFELVPTMNTESNAKNVVWVGTFQLVWNDLIDELIKQPVEFVGTKSVMADNLNRKEFTTSDLFESSYYKKWGLASPKMKKEIEKGIKEKFNETSDILGSFDWTPAERKYILYAMLKKDFEYVEKFDKLPDAKFIGSKENVKYFGVDKDSSGALRRSVKVLFYNNDNDYAVALKSKQNDYIYFYRTDDNKTLDILYKDMVDKADKYNGAKWLTSEDEFKAPNLDFKKERTFDELCNKLIKNTDFMISQAIETIQFKMDETGVKLKSEAGIMMKATSVGPGHRIVPRYFYFNNRYVIFLQEKEIPYFAMKIEDAKALQK